MKRLFKFKYPKLFLLACSLIAAYFLFSNDYIVGLLHATPVNIYLGTFIAGIFFTFGFTSPISAGYFITLNQTDIILFGILGGLGALIGDMIIFSVLKISFEKEFLEIRKTKFIQSVQYQITNRVSMKLRNYLLYSFAGILIASPLPDELGLIVIAGLTKIKPYRLAIISFLLNTIGIMVLLLI